MDPLSDVLRSVRLSGGVFLDVNFTAPWCVFAEITAEDCRFALAAPTQVIAYHFIINGRLLISVDDGPTIEVHAGEVVLLPRNDPHNPLIATLPRMLKLDARQGASRDWVEASVRFAASELTKGRIASSNVMSRLSELLLVEAVREYSSTLGDQVAGWLKGLTDPHVGRALALIHQDPSASWSAEVLAKEVALSRSAFVDRFTTLVGVPPIRYLTVWRLQTARLNLRETRTTIAQLAHSVGYESEEAFSRAFKREFGLPPSRWREQQ
jgi:AraC-like DNA-binding protein